MKYRCTYKCKCHIFSADSWLTMLTYLQGWNWSNITIYQGWGNIQGYLCYYDRHICPFLYLVRKTNLLDQSLLGLRWQNKIFSQLYNVYTLIYIWLFTMVINFVKSFTQMLTKLHVFILISLWCGLNCARKETQLINVYIELQVR